MNHHQTSLPGRGQGRSGYSLVELIVAVGASVVLMGGMASAIIVSNQGLDAPESVSGQRLDAVDAQRDLLADIQHALAFTERTTHAVTFLVPDRDSDGDVETTRYAWSGTPGDPLTYEYNGGSPITLAEDVHQFDLSFLTQTLIAPEVIEDESVSAGKLVFVSGGELTESKSGWGWFETVEEIVSMETSEEGFFNLFEAWGYEVVQISPNQDDSEIQSALSDAVVVFVSSEPLTAALSNTVIDSGIGIVNAQTALSSQFGFSSDVEATVQSTLDIADDQHYMASDYTQDDTIQVLTNAGVMYELGDTYTTAVSVIGKLEDADERALVALESGVQDFNGRTVPGRRVQVPWGMPGQAPGDLTADGQLLLQRALEWAAGAD